MEIIKKILGGIGTVIILYGTFGVFEKIVKLFGWDKNRKGNIVFIILLFVLLYACVICASRYI